MAGSRLSGCRDGRTPRRAGVRCLAIAVSVIAATIIAPVAGAQVPGVPSIPGVPGAPGAPEVPGIPPVVLDTIEEAKDVLVPVLVDVATAAQPVANAAGFAFRPACSASGTIAILIAIGGGALPVNPGFVMAPVFIFCFAAYEPGPADPVFEQVDDAVGNQLEDAVDPVLEQVGDAVTPVRPELSEACSLLGLFGSTPGQVPPPANRFDVTGEVC